MILKVRNWEKFQHYKDRKPPWIKLHFSLLTSKDWVMLTDSERVLAIACMLVASHSDLDSGCFEADAEYIKRLAYLNNEPDFKPLVQHGFLEIVEADASERKQMLAKATTETEKRQSKRREETDFCPFAEIQKHWNDLCDVSGLPQCQIMNTDRKRKANKYWKQEWFRLNWRRIFEAFHSDRWRRENRQHSTFDVMFQKQNPEKFYEVQAESAKKSAGTVAMIQYIGTDGNKHNKYGKSPELLADEMTGHGYSLDSDGIWRKPPRPHLEGGVE